VLAYCEDGDKFAHAWGRAHLKYSREETRRELDRWRQKADGATLCETFDRKSPGICGKCPHRGALRSPIILGMRLPEPMLATDAPPLVPARPAAAALGNAGLPNLRSWERTAGGALKPKSYVNASLALATLGITFRHFFHNKKIVEGDIAENIS